MLFAQNENLLPKSLADGVALKTQGLKHQLSKVRGYRKLTNLLQKSKFSRVFLGALFALFLSGYQPTLAIPPIKQSVVQAQNRQEEVITPADFADTFDLPHPGYLTTKFSPWHPGIDIATGYGMPVKPLAKGVVIETSLGFWGLGHYVVVEHEQDFRSTYGHMGKVFVRKGDAVDSNSTMGTVGMTGRTTGPHTHLEVTKNGRFVDPLTILPAITNWPTIAGNAPYGSGGEINAPKKEVKPTLNLINIGKAGQAEAETKTTPLLRPLLLQPGQT